MISLYYLLARMLSINHIVDYIVPVYTVLVIAVLCAYATNRGKPFVRNYTFTPKRNQSEGEANKDKNWKDDMEGYWNQAEMDDLDSWLKFMRKPLPLRMLAPVMMKRLNIRLKFLEDYTKVHFCRDFSAGPTIFDVIVTVNDPEFVTFKDDATSGYNHLKISIDEDKKTCTMTMKQDGNPDTFAVRKMLDKNTMESVTKGEWQDDKSTGQLRAVFKRIAE